MSSHSHRYIEEITQIGRLTIIRLAKNLTYQTLDQVDKEFQEMTEDLDIQNILFDFKHVTDVDSATVAEFIELIGYMKKNQMNGVVGIVNHSQEFKHLLALAKVENLFHLYSSEKEAFKELS